MSHILFVDDEMQFSAMVAEYLQEKGFEVTLKHSAADGLAAFRSARFEHCCIFLMLGCLFKDGFSLAERCQGSRRKYSNYFFNRANRKGR